MDIRPATKTDMRQLAELWAHAFPGERTVDQRMRQLEAGGVYGGVDTAFIVSDGEAAAGALRAYRLQQQMHGASMPMMGVAAVAVAGHARRRGLGAMLCRHALRHSYDRGDLLSVLYPFRPSFYESLGWGLVGSFHSYRFRPESLRVTHEQPRVMLMRDPVELIAACYERAVARSNGLIARSPRIWRQHIEWPDVHVFGIVDAAGATATPGICVGYAIVHYGTPAAGEDRVFTVRELVADNDEVYNEMLSWLSLQRDSWRMVQYDALPSESLDRRLIDPRTPGAPAARTLFAPVATVIRGPMLRVIRVQDALTTRAEWGIPSFSVQLSVADREIPENSGPFDVVVDGGVARVQAAATDGSFCDAVLAVDAPTFAQIYAGDLAPSDALRLGRARASGDVAGLDALFTASSEFRLLDEF